MQLSGNQLDFAGGEIRIGFLAFDHLAFDANDEFAAHVFGFAVSFGLRFLVEDDLNDSRAIAYVEEQQVAEVATAGDPAQDDGGFAGVGSAQRSTVVGTSQITEKVQHGLLPFPS